MLTHQGTAQALDWCAAAQLQDAWSQKLRWASEPEWRTAVSTRRAAMHPLPTFLQTLLQRIAQVHPVSVTPDR